ncbi:nad dependent epimerase dehydratase family protein [Stemphylium lycopersici]|uniref:Nad dependent epimerase dehydratase family protein n=1 Tax=Stemphylium lycopersici TaxID=183478 RepID=A0A364MXV1_STELY|nr:nad dependent epimerase dehydratase family protein [Stemphylium lycopersici]RAR06634.1 nad dependent epimerase dehydratase family protein [Stemphylium lycopersici]
MPISNGFVEPTPNRELDDAADDVYAYEKERDALHPAPQRSKELSVNMLVIQSPLIYGLGTGLFHTTDLHIPIYEASVPGHGHAVVVGEGSGMRDHVRVQDVAELYKFVLVNVLENGGLRTCRPVNRASSSMENETHVDACFEACKITDKKAESVDMAQGAEVLAIAAPFRNEMMVELAMCSDARTVASLCKRAGWTPMRGENT